MEEIRLQAEAAVRELLEIAGLQAGDLLVIGCSSSEIMGQRIGKGSSMEAAQAVCAGIAPALREKGHTLYTISLNSFSLLTPVLHSMTNILFDLIKHTSSSLLCLMTPLEMCTPIAISSGFSTVLMRE